jgi:hypothetical protein
MPTDKRSVLVIAYYFGPDGPIGGLRPWRFHRFLSQLGYETHVIAASVTSYSQDNRVLVVPDLAGEFWEKRALDREAGRLPERMPVDCHCERILRKTLLPGQHALAWSRTAAQAATKVAQQHAGISAVLSTYPPLGTHLAGFHVARKLKLPWIADFRDPIGITETLSVLGGLGIHTTERMVFRNAAAVIANTELAAENWRRKFPWAADKIHVIWNGYDPQTVLTALPIPQRDHRHIVHVGNLYGNRNGNIILAALMRLRGRKHNATNGIRVILAGCMDVTAGINEELHRAAIADGWLQANDYSVPRVEAQTIAREADGLLLLQPQSTVQVPAKLYEYLSIGRPILALTPRNSSIEWILDRAGIPFVCVYTDDKPEIVDEKVSAYLGMPNTPVTASNWFYRNFNFEHLTAELARIVDQVSEQVSRPESCTRTTT